MRFNFFFVLLFVINSLTAESTYCLCSFVNGDDVELLLIRNKIWKLKSRRIILLSGHHKYCSQIDRKTLKFHCNDMVRVYCATRNIRSVLVTICAQLPYVSNYRNYCPTLSLLSVYTRTLLREGETISGIFWTALELKMEFLQLGRFK